MVQSDKINQITKYIWKQYAEKNTVWKNYMFKPVIDIPAKCTNFQGIFLLKDTTYHDKK